MYDNEIYSGSQAGDHTTGNYSGTYSNTDYFSTHQQNGAYRQEQSTPKANKPHKFWKKAVASVALGLCFGVFAGAGFYGVERVLGDKQTESASAVSEKSANIESYDIQEALEKAGINLNNVNNVTYVDTAISDVVSDVMPAMVSIINNYTETTRFWGQTYSQEGQASGSGIIVSENDTELLIVTNHHVVDGATSLEVTFIDGSTAEAKIKGMDSDMDLAVIAIKKEDMSDETRSAITIATLGDSDNLKLGEPVIAIGNALGYGQSVTNGIVSALNREVEMEDGSVGTFIQTNAAINPGNSGGALLNINGEVIGINSNKIGGEAVEGMGYAIPISSASPIIAELLERQTRDKVDDTERGYIGITLQEVTQQSALMYNMPVGVFVVSVEEGSGAEKAGLVKGDIIVKFDGQKITSNADLQEAIQYFAVGDTTKITIQRFENGEYVAHEYTITLGERPNETR
ncbi:MAG: trypsin-like peptidase domain-containing protein [Acetatifactor sp.]|nr:trypsin-like peptidase domain-containing protein [Acetatifactor sp.]